MRGFTKVQIKHLLSSGESLLCTNQDKKNRQERRRELHDERCKTFAVWELSELKPCLFCALYMLAGLQITMNVNKLIN